LPILIINHKEKNFPKEFSEIEAKRKKIKLKPGNFWYDII
jgi:hypothetical protein